MSAYKFPEFPYNRVGSGRGGNIGLKRDNLFLLLFIMSDRLHFFSLLNLLGTKAHN